MENLPAIARDAKTAINRAVNSEELEKVRIFYLGRKKGALTKIAAKFPSLSPEEKRKVGPIFNSVKSELTKLLALKLKDI